MQTKTAMTLREVFETLSPEPLVEPDELRAFYRDSLNGVRGSDKVAGMQLDLDLAYGKNFYKIFLMGHSGVGKSTELSRLARCVEHQYRALRFDVVNDLNPVTFKPFDVLLLIMVKVAEATAQPVEKGGAGAPPSDSVLRDIWGWFADEKSTITTLAQASAQATAGLGLPADSWWAKVVGLFANVKGEAKFTADRKREVVEYRMSRIYDLMNLMNRLLDECYDLLRKAPGQRDWLIIGESFDKMGIPPDRVEELFLSFGNILRTLHAHLIFNIPIGLAYGPKGAELPLLTRPAEMIPDTPVFHPAPKHKHAPHKEGRGAVREVLEARVTPGLFEPDQMTRLIVASGGNLRDLVVMTSHAARSALLRGGADPKINGSDVTLAVNAMRNNYENWLGQSPYDHEPVLYTDKADRLVKIYQGEDKIARMYDKVLNELLRSRAVQEFNGVRWFGVHPLVVDILADQGRITRDPEGKVPGGTQ